MRDGQNVLGVADRKDLAPQRAQIHFREHSGIDDASAGEIQLGNGGGIARRLHRLFAFNPRRLRHGLSNVLEVGKTFRDDRRAV